MGRSPRTSGELLGIGDGLWLAALVLAAPVIIWRRWQARRADKASREVDA